MYNALLFQVRFIPPVPFVGRHVETCAIEVVPPVIVFEKMLSRTSQLVTDVATIVKAEVKMLAFGAPKSGPKRLTVL